MTDDKPKAEREHVEGKEVWVTKDESGVTALSEDEEGADPRVTTDSDNDKADNADDREKGDDEA
jgi:hypothetical protein